MTTSTVDQTAAALAQAEQARNQAHDDAEKLNQAYANLAERVRDGDTSVTPKQLGDAEQKARHADLFKESHDAAVAKAQQSHHRAQLDEAGARLTAMRDRFEAALDQHAGPAVDHIAALLSELVEAHTERRACAAALGDIPATNTEVPVGVTSLGGPGLGPYAPGVEVPDVDTLVGELLAAAFERVFGVAAYRRSRELTTDRHSAGKTAAFDLAKRWIGARQSTYVTSAARPRFVTVERA